MVVAAVFENGGGWKGALFILLGFYEERRRVEVCLGRNVIHITTTTNALSSR